MSSKAKKAGKLRRLLRKEESERARLRKYGKETR